jgi:hypothetical protein
MLVHVLGHCTRRPVCSRPRFGARVLKHIQAMPERHCLDRTATGFRGRNPVTWAAWAAHPADRDKCGIDHINGMHSDDMEPD